MEELAKGGRGTPLWADTIWALYPYIVGSGRYPLVMLTWRAQMRISSSSARPYLQSTLASPLQRVVAEGGRWQRKGGGGGREGTEGWRGRVALCVMWLAWCGWRGVAGVGVTGVYMAGVGVAGVGEAGICMGALTVLCLAHLLQHRIVDVVQLWGEVLL